MSAVHTVSSKADENAHQIICEIRAMVQSVVQRDAIKLRGGIKHYAHLVVTFDLLEASRSLSCHTIPWQRSRL